MKSIKRSLEFYKAIFFSLVLLNIFFVSQAAFSEEVAGAFSGIFSQDKEVFDFEFQDQKYTYHISYGESVEAFTDNIAELQRAKIPLYRAGAVYDFADVQTYQEALRLQKQALGEWENKIESVPIVPQVAKSLRGRMHDWYQSHYRISFALIRTTLNATVTSWSFISFAHLPPETALTIGILTGSMSGTIQYFNAHFQKWLISQGALSKALHLTSGKIATLTNKAEEFAKWGALEMSFLSTVKLAMFSMGALPEKTFAAVALTIAKTTAASMLGQAFWDLSVAQATQNAIAKNPQQTTKIEKSAALKTLAISAASVSSATMDLLGVPLGAYGLRVLAATGMINYARVQLTDLWPSIKARFCSLYLTIK